MANTSNVEYSSSGSVVSSDQSGSAETSKKRLRQNPFTTYRDPQTGLWMVVKPVPA
jgi:hypothetical protein